MNNLSNKQIVIFGSSRGFGLEIAKQAIAEKADVTLVARNEDELQKTAKELSIGSSKVNTFVADAYDLNSVHSLAEKIDSFDHLVSMIGGAMGGGFMTAPLETIQNEINKKFWTNLNLVRILSPSLKENGSIILTSGSGGKPQNASGAIIGNMNIQKMVEGLAV